MSSSYIYDKRKKAYVKKSVIRKSRHTARKQSPSGGGMCAFIIFSGFLWVAWAAWQAQQPASYSQMELMQMSALVEQATKPKSNAEKMIWLFADDQQPVKFPKR